MRAIYFIIYIISKYKVKKGNPEFGKTVVARVDFFKMKLFYLFGYFDPMNTCFDNENN